ncbi:12001_t:CDS:2, partial [Cetraspora pellucida]
AVNEKLSQDGITGFVQVNSFKFTSNIHPVIPIWYGKHFACHNEGELDFLIKDCTDARTFAERERCLRRFILTYFEEMLWRFDLNEVVRIATDSIY